MSKTFHRNGNFIKVDERLKQDTTQKEKDQRIKELEYAIEKLKDKIAKFYIPRYSFLDDENQLLKQENKEEAQRVLDAVKE